MPDGFPIHVPVPGVPSTSMIPFLFGIFGSSKWRIPYFTTTMSFEDAANDLHLTTDIPDAEAVHWKIEELYQRDIDWPRVEGQIVKYLKSTENPQFFNSLTIALLPYDPVAGSLVESFSADSAEWVPPKLENENYYSKQLDVGPIRFGYYEQWTKFVEPGFQMGVLRWNKKQVYGVAIDGQHRLAAIKKYAEHMNQSDMRVPVILLVFDERVGFLGPEDHSVIGLLRSLFIDLNKHAKTVSRARQLLLDDRDPHARAVRALLAPELSDTLESLDDAPPRLPLALVDWHSELAKFDSGPYVSTVLGVDSIVNILLNTKPLGDLSDYAGVRKQLKQLRLRLGIEVDDAEAAVDQLEAINALPFSYSEELLAKVSDGFAKKWNAPIAHVLTEFRPYRQLVESRAGESLNLRWQHWYRLYSSKAAFGQSLLEYSNYVGALQNGEPPLSEGMCEAILSELDSIKKSAGLGFTVVLQRAIFQALSWLTSPTNLSPTFFSEDLARALGSDEDEEDWEDPFADDEEEEIGTAYISTSASPSTEFEGVAVVEDEMARARMLVAALNASLFGPSQLIQREAVGVDAEPLTYFWSGSLRKPGDETTDFTQAAAVRARDLLICSTLLYGAYQVNSETPFPQVWGRLRVGIAGEKTLAGPSRLILGMTGVDHIAGRVLAAREVDYDPGLAESEIYRRLHMIWKEFGGE